MSQHKKPDPSEQRWRQRFKSTARFLINHTSLPEMMFISTFILIRWWNNSDFSYPSEVIAPILLFAALVTVVFYIYRFILGAGMAVHLAALALSYLFYVFQFIENSWLGRSIYDLLPSALSSTFSRSVVLALVLGSLCGLAAWLLLKIINHVDLLRQLQLYKVLIFAVFFVFSLQLARTGLRLFELRHQLNYQYKAQTIAPLANQSTRVKPDIYYLVLDRYANPQILKENFGYDNSDLLAFLDSQGFVTRQNAYANYPFTMSSIGSTLAMNYFPELEKRFANQGKWQSAGPYRSILNNPPIAQVLARHGYSYNQVSSWWDFTRIGIQADDNPSQSYRLRILNNSYFLSDLQRDIFFKSILSPWLKKGAAAGNYAIVKYDIDRNPAENFDAQLASLKAIANRSDKNRPQFSFAHVLAPHPPYIFDSNGKLPDYDVESNDNGIDEFVKYTNELTYINQRLKELVSDIKQKSPEAVIVLQADEGPYPKPFRGPMSADDYYDPLELPPAELKQKFSIFASYHIPAVEPSEAGNINSSVNVFRFILNSYFGYNLALLPDCHLSTGNKFNLYDYTLVNDRLNGGSSLAECGQYE